MKRHPSLAHLSREHHGALLLARLLQKGAPPYKDLPTDTAGKAAYAFKFYEDNLLRHFDAEEKILKLVTGIKPAIDLLVLAICSEHQEFHSMFKSINNQADIAAHLDSLGKALEVHIRKEERELFPLIQESCDNDLMTAIDASLSTI